MTSSRISGSESKKRNGIPLPSEKHSFLLQLSDSHCQYLKKEDDFSTRPINGAGALHKKTNKER
jgi:hypothetical protein